MSRNVMYRIDLVEEVRERIVNNKNLKAYDWCLDDAELFEKAARNIKAVLKKEAIEDYYGFKR